VAHVVPEHLKEVRDGKLALIARPTQRSRTVDQEISTGITAPSSSSSGAGRQAQPLGSTRQRPASAADALQARLEGRLEELKLEAQISPLPPVVLGGLLVVPMGFARVHERADGVCADGARGHPAQRRSGSRHHHGVERSSDSSRLTGSREARL